MGDVLDAALVGGLAGFAVAVGGAIKDAPMEGFKPKTFIRSPIIGFVEGAVLQKVFKPKSKGMIFLGTIGTERITVETWKILRKDVPGKFTNTEWGMEKPLSEDGEMILEGRKPYRGKTL